MKTQTFDSVFDAISDTPEQAENMKIRAKLMNVLNSWIENQGYSQAEAALALGVTQPRISELARGKIQVFSVDKLISMMAHAGMHIQNMDICYPYMVQAAKRLASLGGKSPDMQPVPRRSTPE
ncbi:XRE family transcriptional regulator [Salmonella enterica]